MNKERTECPVQVECIVMSLDLHKDDLKTVEILVMKYLTIRAQCFYMMSLNSIFLQSWACPFQTPVLGS